jgi:hypothetical protein
MIVRPCGYFFLLISPHARSTTLEEELDDEDLAMMPKKDITLVHIATLDELVSVSLPTSTLK